MSIFDDIESGFEDFGNAVTGVAGTVFDEVGSGVVSFGDSAWNYATIVGDGVASAGHVVGDGIVTFGSDVKSFSVSASGTAFSWIETAVPEPRRRSQLQGLRHRQRSHAGVR